jgi:hypothetical protein
VNRITILRKRIARLRRTKLRAACDLAMAERELRQALRLAQRKGGA